MVLAYCHKKSFFVSIVSILMLSSCGRVQYNPILNDPHFIADLKKAKIAVLSPASSLNPATLQRLRQILGKSVRWAINTPQEQAPLFHSDTDENRLKLLKQELYSNQTEVIWCLRGGYGSARLLDQLQHLPKPKKEKRLIGYSDLTALHLFLNQKWGWQPIHGPVFAELLNDKKAPENFYRLFGFLQGQKPRVLPNLIPLNEAALNIRYKAKTRPLGGSLTGGNLTLVESTIGTPWQIQTKNKILFLEEVEEKGYRIDRSLHHLKQARLLIGVKAIIFGNCEEGGDEHVAYALKRFAESLLIPVYKTDQFGHGKYNFPLVYGAYGRLFFNKSQRDFSLAF